MTKAERIFTDTYTACRVHIKKWGFEENTGFTALSYKDNESVCERTFNAIAKLIATERKTIAIAEKHGFWTAEKVVFYRQALDMTEKTLENTIKSHR